MTPHIIYAALGIAALLFIAYVGYSIMTHKSVSETPKDEIAQDIRVIDKMKEFQLIREAKGIQTIDEKNKLFVRAYTNKYGSGALAEPEEGITENEMNDELKPNSESEIKDEPQETKNSDDFKVITYDEEDDFSNTFARTIVEPSNNSDYLAGSITDNDEESLSQSQSRDISEMLEDFDFKSIAAPRVIENNLPSVFRDKKKSLGDDYSENENTLLYFLSDTFAQAV